MLGNDNMDIVTLNISMLPPGPLLELLSRLTVIVMHPKTEIGW